MQLIELICMFMPAFISLFIDIKINNEKVSVNHIIKYFIYVFMINLVVILFVWNVTDDKNGVLTFTFSFILKYMLSSLIVSLVLPYILRIKNVRVGLEVRKKYNDKKSN